MGTAVVPIPLCLMDVDYLWAPTLFCAWFRTILVRVNIRPSPWPGQPLLTFFLLLCFMCVHSVLFPFPFPLRSSLWATGVYNRFCAWCWTTVLLKSIRQSRVTGCLTRRILQPCHASRRLLTNILFVTVGSKFRFRGAQSNFLDLWALLTQFLAHF
jgi:hypothetical protein